MSAIDTTLFDLGDYPAVPRSLHIFVRNDGDSGDIVIAHDADDARLILEDITGEYVEDGAFEQHPDDQAFSITEADEPGRPTTTLLPAEWVAQEGRGYLGGWA